MAQHFQQTLPARMATLNGRGDWSVDLWDALCLTLGNGDPLPLGDLFETLDPLADRFVRLDSRIANLTARYSPADIYHAWDASLHGANVVQQPDLTDVLGDYVEWTGDLVLEAAYWLTERCTPEQLRALAVVACDAVMVEAVTSEDFDVEELVDTVARSLQPRQLRDVWKWIAAAGAARSVLGGTPRSRTPERRRPPRPSGRGRP